ncbi:MAG: class I SAM-dependent methyltransferase [Candidatus Omnitrophica bacterium]|nr:class I SAM-dependent methyltransferase [Candidatus Omnitrophota bacterium]
MKGRESGMPARETWERFFKPEEVLKIMGLDERAGDVAEFGCGYGTFTIPAAKMVQGTVFALDIEQEMVTATENEAREQGLYNVQTLLRDFMADGSGLKDASVDCVMLFNILHVERPEILLKEAYRILRRGGKLGIIHWNYDPATPRGPSMEIRPKPEQCTAWAREAGFIKPKRHDLEPHHYGIVMMKGKI